MTDELPEINSLPNTTVFKNGKCIITDDQQKAILNLWNSRPLTPPTVKELIDAAYPGSQFDMRSIEGKTVLEFLASRQIVVKQSGPPKTIIVLTEEQKQYVKNHYKTHRIREMARDLFKNNKLRYISQECRAIKGYIEEMEIKETDLFDPDENVSSNESGYSPPMSLGGARRRVEKYKRNAITDEEFNKNSKVKKCLQSLIQFCHMYRFMMIMESFKRKKDKDLFESSYIRFVWDKPDLTEEELDMVCNLCSNIVRLTNMGEELEELKALRNNCADDSEGHHLAKGLVDTIANLHKEMDDNEKRQNEIIKRIQGERKTRIENEEKGSASMLQLVEAWREEKERVRLVRLRDQQRKNIKAEVDKIETVDSVLGEIFGLDREDFE